MPLSVFYPDPIYNPVENNIPTSFIDISWFGSGEGYWSAPSVLTLSVFNGAPPALGTYTNYYVVYNKISYKILSNTTNTITVENGLSSGGSLPILISSLPDYYKIEYFEYLANTTTIDENSREVVYADAVNPTFGVVNSFKRITGLRTGVKYGVRIASVYGALDGETSGWSNTPDIIAGVGTTPELASPVLTSATASINTVSATWSEVFEAAYYKLAWNANDVPAALDGNNIIKDVYATSYTITSVEALKVVRLAVWAVDRFGRLSLDPPADNGAGTTVLGPVTGPQSQHDYFDVAVTASNRSISKAVKFFHGATITALSFVVDTKDFHGQTGASAKIRMYQSTNEGGFVSLTFKSTMDDITQGGLSLEIPAGGNAVIDAVDENVTPIDFTGTLTVTYFVGTGLNSITV